MPPAATIAPAVAAPRDLFGQPRGLAYLAGTELWDRISFHGMQALLVLYMVGQLLLPDMSSGLPALPPSAQRLSASPGR